MSFQNGTYAYRSCRKLLVVYRVYRPGDCTVFLFIRDLLRQRQRLGGNISTADSRVSVELSRHRRCGSCARPYTQFASSPVHRRFREKLLGIRVGMVHGMYQIPVINSVIQGVRRPPRDGHLSRQCGASIKAAVYYACNRSRFKKNKTKHFVLAMYTAVPCIHHIYITLDSGGR